MNEEIDVFCVRLKNFRVEIGLSQSVFAGLGSVSLRVQQRYERGESYPDQRYFEALAKNGVDILYLITGQRTVDRKELKPDEAALLDNYRNSLPEEQRAIRTTSTAFAQRSKAQKVKKSA